MGKWQGLPAKTSLIDRRKRSFRGYFVVGIGLLLVVGLLNNPLSREGGSEPEATPTLPARPVAAALPTLAPTATVPATPRPTLAPSPEPRRMVVANTGGEGVFIRRTTSLADRIKAWPERSLMVLIGEEREADGRKWLNVRDPDGNEGWVPSQYLAIPPAQTPTASARPRS